jgi:glycosyltransferase involved in cell wall biosynthesis
LLVDAPWRLIVSIVGTGPLDGQLRQLAGELGILDRVEFIGAMEHSAVSGWLRSLDAFVLAAKMDANGDMDGVPVAVMEAMSQQVPVISTRISGIPELVIHEQTGLLAQPSNPKDLACQLHRLLLEPELRTKLAFAGAQHIRTEFSQEVNLNRLLEHFAAASRQLNEVV